MKKDTVRSAGNNNLKETDKVLNNPGNEKNNMSKLYNNVIN